MLENFIEKHKDLYNEYDFEEITHKDALYIYVEITELEICKECNSIRDIQNIRTKCKSILNTLEKYKTNRE